MVRINSGRRTITVNGLKKKFNKSTGQLLNFAEGSYLERTSRPLYAVAFLLPFIIFYELGTFSINTDVLNQSQIRVVAFVWLQHSLESLGFGGKFAWAAPPLAVIVILLSLQLTSGKQWYFWVGDIPPMVIECVLLAIPLIVLTLLISSTGAQGQTGRLDQTNQRVVSPVVCYAAHSDSIPPPVNGIEDNQRAHSLLANIVTGIGAGIYEELVFRLILICLLMMLFQDVFKLSHETAIVLSIMISAALFSAHHHIDFLSGRPNANDPFDLSEFVFRTIAGIYFAILYAIRGFGITAGTHAFYNIMAVSITAFFFPG